jgi:PleD family two-component response regulator
MFDQPALGFALIGPSATQALEFLRGEAEARRLAREKELQNTDEELERINQKLFTLTTADPLTGLSNRRALSEIADREFRRARRNARAVGIIFLDLDHFKDTNDRHGHPSATRS